MNKNIKRIAWIGLFSALGYAIYKGTTLLKGYLNVQNQSTVSLNKIENFNVKNVGLSFIPPFLTGSVTMDVIMQIDNPTNVVLTAKEPNVRIYNYSDPNNLVQIGNSIPTGAINEILANQRTILKPIKISFPIADVIGTITVKEATALVQTITTNPTAVKFNKKILLHTITNIDNKINVENKIIYEL